MTAERIRNIAHVGMVELLTPTIEESRRFFVGLMAMTEVARDGDSIYLLSWDDHENWTVKLTESPQPGIGRTWLRAASPAARAATGSSCATPARGSCWRPTGGPSAGPARSAPRARRGG